MAKISLFTIFLFLYMCGIAQAVDPKKKRVEEAYEKFNEEFHGEFREDTGTSDNAAVMTYRPAVRLREWFFDLPLQEAGNNHSIGISDPGLDSLDAMEQATIRALALAAFMRRCEIQNISDNYYTEHAGEKTLGKFNSFTSFAAADTLGFSVRDYQYTTNGEMIVLIEFGENMKNVFVINSGLELYQSETSGRLTTRLMLSTDATKSNGEFLNTSWLLKENSKSYEIESDWNGRRLAPLKAKLKYLSPPEETAEKFTVADFRFDLKYGLWYGYLNALAANLEQMEVFTSQVKFLDEKYDARFQDLTRVIFAETMSFRIKDIQIIDNQLSIDLEKF